MRRRHGPLALTPAVAAVTLVVALVGLLPGTARAAARFYLALGTSLSVGTQPSPAGANRRTHDGYADQLHQALEPTHPGLRLVRLGCLGETSVTMMTGGICAYPAGSQLAEAEQFLRDHRGRVALVTLDLGANDIEQCAGPTGIDAGCVLQAFAHVTQRLPPILAALRAAAGPDVPLVAMTYYNPLVVSWLLGPEGQALARTSVDALAAFNALLSFIYGQFAVPVADVAGAFHAHDPLPASDSGQIPLSVQLACLWTWMCAPSPVGPNIHANADGYHVISQAFLAVLAP